MTAEPSETVLRFDSLPTVKRFGKAGVKITRGPGAPGPYLGGWAPRSLSLGARQATRNFRGQNIENQKIFEIHKPGPADSDEGP